mmetsp:Transcript_17092/g.42823  ORF Transcript_17092/g.42823 Transcript_17092/m.42823 type:complete len:162 (+) Transcript_17092:719-1204(+)
MRRSCSTPPHGACARPPAHSRGDTAGSLAVGANPILEATHVQPWGQQEASRAMQPPLLPALPSIMLAADVILPEACSQSGHRFVTRITQPRARLANAGAATSGNPAPCQPLLLHRCRPLPAIPGCWAEQHTAASSVTKDQARQHMAHGSIPPPLQPPILFC